MQIKCNQINFIYQPKTEFAKHALVDINTTFAEGKITCIVGNTGSGKSTLIQLFNAIERPSSGEIFVGNKWIIQKKNRIKDIKNLRQSVGQVFQFAEYQLFEDTVKKDILFGLKSLGQKKTQEYYDGAANKYIKLVGLKTEFLDSSPFELSGGQKRRVAIAGILAMDPDVIIFDEPTAGLDPDGEIEIMKIIESLQKEHHKTIIFITHNMDHVLEHADNVIVMKNGEITATGTPIEIFEDKSIIEKNDLLLPKVYEIIHDARLVNELRKYKKEVRNIKDLAKFILWSRGNNE
ncbi:hypothetical protein ASO20_01980 [Mycoplasma sp. (ex Biomphalaria glabrata)]|uniref:energy-coupling factor transporter ATPase n=1 Tax=Mycoplasma sp. (ex Biomphalaria glabrata) TaxID=1749074 RepID=UPI00073AE183|nr:energy-coupling factor transporter ATPase [Mycoplasma sp. (ex Biomphalaria glabrata)]ALV23414.1 hypothetical protein ASO20_01980 [Mycoplasma sp. (ex Biomphalaria glabrata)]